MGAIPLYQVDAFTAEPFHGNPAGVCLLDEIKPDAWMQSVAKEMNLSETAFLLPEGEGYRLRWFTPAVEVNLCGHATLASAHVLYETGRLDPSLTASFQTRSGLLTAARREDWIELNFPASPPEEITVPPDLAYALGAQPLFVGRAGEDYLVVVEDELTLRSLKPDFGLLKTLPARGVTVTCRSSTPGRDFISRFFAPQVGINEDPVTGSAHCYLTPFWGGRLHKKTLKAFQASERGGDLQLELAGERVLIRGRAVTVFEAKLLS
ncbi:MAG TPA: PhzF family phenazine biosynthesis protein [Longilinea sp.]|nr:PhzF family phenazine biosynthesis protein [Longilinea sp.]